MAGGRSPGESFPRVEQPFLRPTVRRGTGVRPLSRGPRGRCPQWHALKIVLAKDLYLD